MQTFSYLTENKHLMLFDKVNTPFHVYYHSLPISVTPW